MERQIVTPYLCCRDAARALEYYERVFGAVVSNKWLSSEGVIGHADLEVAGGKFMLSDEWPSEQVWSPAKYGGSPISIHLKVDDVDSLATLAVAEGGKLERPPRDEPHGQRMCVLRDPFGHRWFLATDLKKEKKA